MLKREADKEGLDVEGMLAKIDASARPSTDADAQMFYKTQSAAGRIKDPQTGKVPPFEEVKDRIKQHLADQSKSTARQAFFAKIMEGNEPKVHLQQPEPPLIADVSTDDDHVKGNVDAKVTIVEFSDLQCPACKQAHFQFGQVLEKHGDKVKFVYRDFPLLGKHPDALPAAVAANCVGKQDKKQYWTMIDGLFKAGSLKEADFRRVAETIPGIDPGEFAACLKDPAQEAEVRKDLDDGRKYGVNSTPTFYVNGYLVVGANMAEIDRLVLRELGESGS
jgi:protein-disulfide isomerase